MASAEAESRSDKKEKKEKKDKKRKHSEAALDVDDVEIVAEKKKKDKKRKSTDAGDVEAIAVVDTVGDAAMDDVKEEDEDKKVDTKSEIPLAALVPFANPLCGDKDGKKVLKSVKRGMFYSLNLMLWHLVLTLHCSRQAQAHHPRRQGDRQSDPQVTHVEPCSSRRRAAAPRNRYSGRRYLAHGCDKPYSCTLRRPQHPVRFRTEPSRAGCGRKHEATDECGDDHRGQARSEEGWCRQGRGEGVG